ncbi:fibrous sheath-interacting protein 2 [Motacilla alba alba]|uniref:fibrous sheath-interacting protein 2 n=1 Tax=Motacilla alba alba TaxID=1094192 RepID=UPI0018D550EB|nr:fibrous sheath-interacting protein 2 [Motacilla alba alba]
MDPELLNLPLTVKIPVAPGSKPVFCRGKLGEKLHQPFPYFTLDDPYIHHLSPAYNCLHDPVLRDYHKRKDVLRLLKKQGCITSDNKVICTVKEFNEYRQYLTRIKLQSEQILEQQRKPDGTANGLLNAVFEQLTAAEAKKLEELVETVVYRVLERLKIPENQHPLSC